MVNKTQARKTKVMHVWDISNMDGLTASARLSFAPSRQFEVVCLNHALFINPINLMTSSAMTETLQNPVR